MRRVLPWLLVLVTLAAAPLPAQVLVSSLPADVLVYFRQSNPMKAAQKVGGSGLLWDRPVDVQRQFLDQMDNALGHLDQMLGIQTGSISTYLHSIQEVEGVLYRLELTDGFPEIDLALAIRTPQADEIYKLLSGKLIEDQIASDLGDNEMELNFGDSFGLNVAQRDDRIIIASDQRRLRETMKSFGSVVEGGLAQSRFFKDAVGEGQPDNCLYVRAGVFLDMLRNERSAFRGRDGMMGKTVATALGLWDLHALGFVEGERQSRLGIIGSKTIPAFDILSAQNGSTEMLEAMPAETVLGIVWCGDSRSLWKKGSALALDQSKVPMAPQIEAGLARFQEMTGLKIDEIAEVASGGMAFSWLPDERGRLDDDLENFVVAIRSGDPGRSKETLLKLAGMMAERHGGSLETDERGDAALYRIKTDERDVPVLAFTEDLALMSTEPVLQRVLATRAGQHPSLGSLGALKGLKPGASAYVYVGLKTIFAQDGDFASTYHDMKDAAGVAAALDIAKDRLVVTTNQPLGEVMNAFMVAVSREEGQQRERRRVLSDLEEIAKAYREYRGKHGKDPATFADLGFTGEKALLYPPDRPEGQAGKPYILLQVGEVADTAQHDTVVAYAPDTKYGRLVALFSGRATSWPEWRFQDAMKRQQSR